MFVRNAISWLGQQLQSAKEEHFTKQLLMPLLLLASIKNYLLRFTSEQKLFIVPQDVKNKAKEGKIILVLDLDETLVFARDPTPPADGINFFTVKASNGETIYVRPRPHLEQFLAAVSSVFTVYVYTAGRKAYADAILDVIDQNKVVSKRFYRDHCVPKNKSFVKNLKKLPSETSRMVLVDDNNESIKLNAPNAILIRAFEGSNEDRELWTTFTKLMELYKSP